jgi:prepilin-type N-terminal cleavage/methylation domain-containing protein
MKREQGLPAFGGVRGDRGLSGTPVADDPARSVAGFTLIELMIAIVILCLLLGLAIPGFSKSLSDFLRRGQLQISSEQHQFRTEWYFWGW